MAVAALANVMGGMMGGDKSSIMPATATSGASAGAGSMTFGGGKTQSALIFGSVAVVAALLYFTMKGRK